MSLQRVPRLTLAAVLSLAYILCSCKQQPSGSGRLPHRTTDTTAQVVHLVSRQSRLYTTEFKVHKIVTFNDAPTIEGQMFGMRFRSPARLGERKVAIPIDLTLKAYIDFSDFSTKNVEHTADGITITLPDPRITATASKIDNRGVRQYIDGLRSGYTDAEITALARQGADSILSHASQIGIVERAEQSAVRQLTPMLRRLGYADSQVTIRFRKHFTDGELLHFIEKS